MSELPTVLTCELTRLQLKPGDVLVVKLLQYEGQMTEDTRMAWRDLYQRLLPENVGVIVYDGKVGEMTLTRIEPPRLFAESL